LEAVTGVQTCALPILSVSTPWICMTMECKGIDPLSHGMINIQGICGGSVQKVTYWENIR
jgi:hypothetical protein